MLPHELTHGKMLVSWKYVSAQGIGQFWELESNFILIKYLLIVKLVELFSHITW